jgi:AraC family transcriptional regulator
MSESSLSTYEKWIKAIAESTPNLVQSHDRGFGLQTALVSYTDKQISAPAFSEHIIVLHLNQIPRLIGRIEGKQAEIAVKSGEMSILAPGQESRWEWQDPKVCQTFYLALDSLLFRRVARDYGYTIADTEILNQSILRDPQIQYIGLALKAELESEGQTGSLFQESLAIALTSRLLSQYTTLPPRRQQLVGVLSGQQLQLVIDYINDNLSQDLRLADLASVIGLSESHFTRQFKRTTGTTPYQYVIQSRIERAKLLLCQGQLTIQEVALQVGFADQSHLTYHFKRTLGVTPKQFLE